MDVIILIEQLTFLPPLKDVYLKYKYNPNVTCINKE